MKINIEEIKNAPLDGIEIKFCDFIEGLNLKEKVKADLVAKTSDININIRGKVKADLILQCDRCLNDYDYSVEFELNENFVIAPTMTHDHAEVELKEFVEELGDEKEIDLTDLIYQAIILEIPNKNLCNPECEGMKEFQGDFEEKSEDYIDERLEVFKRFSENNLDDEN